MKKRLGSGLGITTRTHPCRALALLAIAALSACGEQSDTQMHDETIALESIEQKASYVIGYSTAKHLQGGGMDSDVDAMLLAIEDVKQGKALRLTEGEMRGVMANFQAFKSEREKRLAREANARSGQEYMQQNAQKEGVTVTASGLQYEVLQSGEGATPALNDVVRVRYHGTLIDGSVFDSAGDAVEFPVNQVIPGWTEALLMMQEGDKWRVTLPPSLAYPDGTMEIDPGSVLVFEIELIEVLSPEN